MDIVARIEKKLLEYPALAYRVADTTITVDPVNAEGFAVCLSVDGHLLTVGFDGWHEVFESEDEALNCFLFGLSDRCRLRIDLRGTFPYRWTVESRTADGWVEDSTLGLLLFPFWRRRSTVYHQNAVH